ncbi:MAG: TonB-dependent receptor [Bacteroidota bacterium]
MKHFVLSIILLLTSFSVVYSQTAQIQGKVLNGDEPLEFATVVLKKTPFGATTDQNGEFLIKNIPFGSYEIEINMLGFVPLKKELSLSEANPSVDLKFNLEESSLSLDEVVISGTMKEVNKLDSPVPVEVYSASFFKANPAPSIFESLQNVNGVRPQLNCNVCNTGDIHINGLEGPYTMVMLDGMPIVSGLSTVYGLTGIPQSLIERVEVVKGPASTLYGSEAVGGLINIITKKPGNAPLFSADVMGSSWGEVNTDLGLKYRMGKKAEALFGLNYFNYQNPIDNNGDGFTDVTLQNRISLFNKISFSRKDGKDFSIAGRYVYEDRWGGQMNWESKFRGGEEVYGESIYTNRWEFIANYQLPVDENIRLQISANGHDQNSVYGNMPYLAKQNIGFAQLVWNKPLGEKHDILAGAAYRYTFYDDNTPATATFDTTSTPLNQAAVTHLPGLFVQDEISLNQQNKLLLGVRYDYNSSHGDIFSPRINYKWNSANKRNVLRLSAGNGYRVANIFTEDHAALSGARQVELVSELKPETSWNANLNFVKKIFTQNNTYIGLDASAFYTHFGNRIIADYETDPNKIIYDNLDGFAVSKGVSLNVDMAFNSGLNVLAGVTLMDVYSEENGERDRQLLTERVAGVWSISYTFSGIGLSLDYTGNLYGPMELPLLGERDPRAAESPWWSLQNIQITKRTQGPWEIYGGVKNLLNYTPPANSIARAFDPFDQGVSFDDMGQVIATPNNPNALSFDPTYVFAPNQGIRAFLGLRYTLN